MLSRAVLCSPLLKKSQWDKMSDDQVVDISHRMTEMRVAGVGAVEGGRYVRYFVASLGQELLNVFAHVQTHRTLI